MTGLLRRAPAGACGTAMLLVAVVGSGIMAERLSGGNVALTLLANAVATGGALVARAATDTFAGIRPADVPGFLLGQAVGATVATGIFRWLAPRQVATAAPDLLAPHSSPETSR
ncbi:MAG: hypothetical protein ACXWLP_07640 [Myxococcaceae bacterium]